MEAMFIRGRKVADNHAIIPSSRAYYSNRYIAVAEADSALNPELLAAGILLKKPRCADFAQRGFCRLTPQIIQIKIPKNNAAYGIKTIETETIKSQIFLNVKFSKTY
ncbi:MAG: hypothetical protein LBC98_01555 [Prevotellaceae bacterium]|jgi:hypothetical protein|nr:hypothetical protein [Prevotellaceae bacterium]